MTECTNCGYYITYPNNERTCLMKQNFSIINGETVYPKNCEYWKGDDVIIPYESYNFGVNTKAKRLYTETTGKVISMAEKRFTIVNMGLDGQFIKDTGKIMIVEDVVDLLNAQHEEIELWKGNCLDAISESQILENELDMAIEQGYEPSVPYQKYRKAKDNEIKQVFEYLQIFNEEL